MWFVNCKLGVVKIVFSQLDCRIYKSGISQENIDFWHIVID